jgi:endonuclease/exonuclease/phosphatase family metal-dependent hydrolase
MRKIILQSAIAFVAFFCWIHASAQDKTYKVGCVGFYNTEDFYDTINDPKTNDDDFTPDGKNNWTSQRYWTKVEHISTVISQIGDELVKGGPVVMGLSEIETQGVLEDLVKAPALQSAHYGIVYYKSPDKRGICVAMLYQKDHFAVINSKPVPLYIKDLPDFRTRDQLVVYGKFDGDPMYFIVNHWPSRYGGEERSASLRNAAADLTKSIVDSIQKIDSTAKIVVMGDLNDDPTNESIVKHLKAKDKIKEVGQTDLFNPMYTLYKKDGIGTLDYHNNWDLFDQIMVTGTLLGDDKSTYKFYRACIFNKKTYLFQQDGQYKGYPLRTYAAGAYLGGYSDHLPSYIFLIKQK